MIKTIWNPGNLEQNLANIGHLGYNVCPYEKLQFCLSTGIQSYLGVLK